jgi:hypothetical protein
MVTFKVAKSTGFYDFFRRIISALGAEPNLNYPIIRSGDSSSTLDDKNRKCWEIYGESIFKLDEFFEDWKSIRSGTGNIRQLSGVKRCTELLQRDKVFSIGPEVASVLSSFLAKEYKEIVPALPKATQLINLDQYNLTDRQRECMNLKFNHGLTNYKIGKHLGISAKTVQGHIEAGTERISHKKGRGAGPD